MRLRAFPGAHGVNLRKKFALANYRQQRGRSPCLLLRLARNVIFIINFRVNFCAWRIITKIVYKIECKFDGKMSPFADRQMRQMERDFISWPLLLLSIQHQL